MAHAMLTELLNQSIINSMTRYEFQEVLNMSEFNERLNCNKKSLILLSRHGTWWSYDWLLEY